MSGILIDGLDLDNDTVDASHATSGVIVTVTTDSNEAFQLVAYQDALDLAAVANFMVANWTGSRS